MSIMRLTLGVLEGLATEQLLGIHATLEPVTQCPVPQFQPVHATCKAACERDSQKGWCKNEKAQAFELVGTEQGKTPATGEQEPAWSPRLLWDGFGYAVSLATTASLFPSRERTRCESCM